MLPRSARAHSLNVDAFIEGHSVAVEAYFGDGKPVANAIVRVRSQAGQELQTGTTDTDGRFRFQPAGSDPLTVEVVQAGHKGIARIEKQALAPLAGLGGSASSQPAASATSAPGTVLSVQPVRVVHRTMRDNQAIPAIAGIALILSAACLWRIRTLSRRVEHLRRQLELRNGPPGVRNPP